MVNWSDKVTGAGAGTSTKRSSDTFPYDVTGLTPGTQIDVNLPGSTVQLTPLPLLTAPVLAAYPGTPYSFEQDTGVQTIAAPINSGGAVDPAGWSLVGNTNPAVTINSNTGVVSVDTNAGSFVSEAFTTQATNAAGSDTEGFNVAVTAAAQDIFYDILFAAGEQGTVFIPGSTYGDCFQETTGASATTPCANGDPIGTYHDKVTGLYLTAPDDASRPIYTVSGANTWAEFNGAQQLTGLLVLDTDVQNIGVLLATTIDGDTSNITALSLNDRSSNNGYFQLKIQDATTIRGVIRTDAAVATQSNLTVVDATGPDTHLTQREESTGNLVTEDFAGASQTVAFSDTMTTLDKVSVGVYGSLSPANYFDGRIYAAVARFAETNAANKTLLKNHINGLLP